MMKNSVSDNSFYIDSEDEVREDGKCEVGNESDVSSNYSNDNDVYDHHQSKPNSFNNAWPQSYSEDQFDGVVSDEAVIVRCQRFYSVDVNNVPHKLVVRAGVTKMPTTQVIHFWKEIDRS